MGSQMRLHLVAGNLPRQHTAMQGPCLAASQADEAVAALLHYTGS